MEHQTTVEEAFDAAPATVEAPITTVTEENPALENGKSPEAEPVDYKEKFSSSTREEQKRREERDAEKARADAAEAELARLREEGVGPGSSSEVLFPGFEELSEDQQRDLQQFSGTIRKQAVDEILKDPAIAHARESYNRTKFNEAFDKVATELPELREIESDFKRELFRPNNVPDNIESILRDVAKSRLYDRARDIGAAEGREQAERIDIERARGGEGPRVTTSRTLEEWNRMSQENPAEFARHSKEYDADIEAGKLGE